MLLQLQSDAQMPALNLLGWRNRAPIIISQATVRPRRQEADSALMLETALDNRVMTDYVRPRLLMLAQAHNLHVSSSRLLDCKPGQRALVRYQLTSPQEHKKLVLYGKVYSQLDQLMRVDQVMDALWYDVFDGDSLCGLPQPLGLIPDLSMHLYVPVQGKFLDTALAEQEGTRAMRLTGRWLAMLHRYPLSLAKRFDLANELKNLAAWSALVVQRYPQLACQAHALLSYLQRQAQTIVLESHTPIHKDFHYRHVLVEQGVNVIDFDEMRLGDRNFDLAHFCANLHLLAYRQQRTPHHFQQLEACFLQAYARHVGQSWSAFIQVNQERFNFFYVYSCIKIARQLCLGFGPSPAPVDDARRQQVQMILTQGENRL